VARGMAESGIEIETDVVVSKPTDRGHSSDLNPGRRHFGAPDYLARMDRDPLKPTAKHSS